MSITEIKFTYNLFCKCENKKKTLFKLLTACSVCKVSKPILKKKNYLPCIFVLNLIISETV